jgi:hypothetical protein
MATEDEHSPAAEEQPTIESALTNAARLLHCAEMEVDLKKMERIEKLADSWISVAGVMLALNNRE